MPVPCRHPQVAVHLWHRGTLCLPPNVHLYASSLNSCPWSPVFLPISTTSQPGHLPLLTCPSTYRLTLSITFSHKADNQVPCPQTLTIWSVFPCYCLSRPLRAMPAQQDLMQPSGEPWSKCCPPGCPTGHIQLCLYALTLVTRHRLPKEGWDLKFGGSL